MLLFVIGIYHRADHLLTDASMKSTLSRKRKENMQDDPLDAVYKNIAQLRLTQDPSELLQEATTKFKEPELMKRYKNDARLLQLWIWFSTCLDDPSDVFMYLQSRGTL